MATTVSNAFDEFMKKIVNLDPNEVEIARTSRDNLLSNIAAFSDDIDFFDTYDKRSLKFGSFARSTKIRELDDIDLMICLSGGEVRYYEEDGDYIYIVGDDFDSDNGLLSDYSSHLNSTKVINRFIKKLKTLNDYGKAEMRKNQEAATLKLKSYTWNYDIVPCFYTVNEFYLIPDGSGNWKKADPRIDNERTTSTNQKHNGKLLELIRLIKYWNKRPIAPTIPSYLLECMIVKRYIDLDVSNSWWIDFEFQDTVDYLSKEILNAFYDPKGIQGDLNNFSIVDRAKISKALANAKAKAEEAIQLETSSSDYEASINKWREILGTDFPLYG